MIAVKKVWSTTLLASAVLWMSHSAANAISLSQIQPAPQFVLNGSASESFKIDPSVQLSAQFSAAGKADSETFARQIQRLARLKVVTENSSPVDSRGRFSLLLKKDKAWRGPSVWPATPKRAEGYALVIEEGGFALQAFDARGYFYGLQTISQLLAQAVAGDGRIPLARISDWPAMSQRSTLLIIKNLRRGGNIEYVKNLLAGLAAMKYNSVFLQFDSAIPGPNSPFPETVKDQLTDAQVADICATARRHHLTVNLAFQFGAHATWILNEPAYAKFGENFKQPISWDNSNLCPLNPQLWKVLGDLVAHQIKLCKPQYVHIAHDEIGHGEFAEHPLCKNSGLSKEELIATSLRKLRQIVPPNTAKLIMWHDLLMPDAFKSPPYLGVVNGPKLLHQVPPGTDIAIWDYNGSPNHIPAIDFFTGNKRNFWVSTFEAAGAFKVGSYGAMNGATGLIATHWHEGGLCTWDNPTSFSAAAMNAMVAAAAAAWNPREDATLTANVDRVKLFHDLVEGVEPRIVEAEWQPLKTEVRQDTTANGTVLEDFLNSLPERLTADSGIPYDRFPQPVILPGKRGEGQPSERTKVFPVGRDVLAVHFLQTCDVPSAEAGMSSWQAAQSRPEIGSYRLKFREGEDVVIPLTYRWNIQDWNALQGAYATQVAWQATFGQGISGKLTQVSWSAKDGRARRLESIDFTSTTELGLSPALAGITLQTPSLQAETAGVAGSKVDNAILAEGFNYESTQALLNQWDGYELNARLTQDIPGAKSAVEVILPPAANTERLNFGKKNLDLDLSKANTLSLRMKTTAKPGDAVTCIVYLGNTKGEQSYWMYYGLTINSDWQDLKIPLGMAVTEGTAPANGASKADTIMIAFWHKNQQPITVAIDDFAIGRYIGPEVFNSLAESPTHHRLRLND